MILKYILITNFFLKIFKLFRLTFHPDLFKFLLRGVLPSFEHEKALGIIGKQESLIDCGCNKGQFAILAHKLNKFSEYVAFDPICYPGLVIDHLKKNDIKTFYKNVALSNAEGLKDFFITGRNDSSSLKKPKELASKYFPKVYLKKQIKVQVLQLKYFKELIIKTPQPRFLKIDVQGNELELLEGGIEILNLFQFIVIECTHFKLYKDIKYNIYDLHSFLSRNKFKLIKEYNNVISNGELISSDRLYKFIK